MNGSGTVEAIHIAPEPTVPMESRNDIEAIAGKGLRGDRYFNDEGTFSHLEGDGFEITLTEAEAIEAIEREANISLGFDEHRRNITTRDVALNHLVGKQFRVGEAVCEGFRLCEPCDHLRQLTTDGVEKSLTHRGGLRANIVDSGPIAVGDSVSPL